MVNNLHVQLVPLSATTPHQLHKSGLSHWGARKIEEFYHNGFEYWSYPTDCFYKSEDCIFQTNITFVDSLGDVK